MHTHGDMQLAAQELATGYPHYESALHETKLQHNCCAMHVTYTQPP